MITAQTIEQIKSRIDIIEIVGSFVKLKKRGSNYIGLCPFHNEKTPSFSVSPSKEFYKCFGCGKSGNSIGFLMELEKYSYVEALRWLAARYNVTVEETETSPEIREQQQTAESLHILNGFAQAFFTRVLLQEEEGQSVGLAYLKERGFRDDIIEKFQLGYDPQTGDAFAREAIAAQYNPDLLQKSGLVQFRDGRAFDNYRGRIIFPIHNQTGKVLGFGARVIKTNDRAPKYINTPENEIYIKSRILYGSYFARQSIGHLDECLLVEGYTDVVSLHQSGVENVVASGGTSLTPDQLRLIKKLTSNLTLVYDGDAAGIKAARRGMDLAFEEGLNVKLVLIPDQEDPDSWVRKKGAAAFRDLVANGKKDFILFQLETSLADVAGDSNKKSQLVNQIAETISRINKAEDFTRQQDYIRRSSQLIGIDEDGLNALVNKFIRDRTSKSAAVKGKAAEISETPLQPQELPDDRLMELLNKDEQQERAIVRTLLEFGLKEWNDTESVASYLLAELQDEEMMDNKSLFRIVRLYEQWYREGKQPDSKSFLYYEDKELSMLTVALIDFPFEVSHNWSTFYEGKIFTREELYLEEVRSALLYLKLRKIRRLIHINQKDLETAKSTEDQMMYMQTHLHLKQMEKDLLATNGTVIVKM